MLMLIAMYVYITTLDLSLVPKPGNSQEIQTPTP
jgi:hypothetical protein